MVSYSDGNGDGYNDQYTENIIKDSERTINLQYVHTNGTHTSTRIESMNSSFSYFSHIEIESNERMKVYIFIYGFQCGKE